MSKNSNEDDLSASLLEEQDIMAQVLKEHQADDSSEASFTDVLNESEMASSEPYSIYEDENLDDAANVFAESHTLDVNHDFEDLNASSELDAELKGVETELDVELNGVETSNDLNAELGGVEGGNGESALHETELDDEVNEPKKKSNAPIYAVIAIVFVLILGGAFFVISSMISAPVAKEPPTQQAPQIQTQPKSSDETSSSNNNDDAYNVISGLTTNDVYEIDLADQDPEIRNHIQGLYQTIDELQQRITTSTDATTKLANMADVAKQNENNLKNKLLKAQKEKSKLEGQISNEKQKLKKERENSEKMNRLHKQALEKKDSALEDAKNAYNKLQNESSNRAAQDSAVIKQLADNVADLTLEVRSIKAPKEKPKTVRPLAELRWIGIDYKQSAAIFEVYRNGIKDKKPIKVITGESILGRGVVLNVDDYGCVTFESGKKYQPLNGKCR